MNRKKRIIIYKIIFGIYAAVMIYLLFFARRYRLGGLWQVDYKDYFSNLKYNIGYIPFQSIRSYWKVIQKGYGWPGEYENLFGNILIFIPFGILLPAIKRRFRRFHRFIKWTLIIVVSIEVIQLFSLQGIFDVDDIILNVTGAVIGFLISKPLRQIRRKIDRKIAKKKELKAQ